MAERRRELREPSVGSTRTAVLIAATLALVVAGLFLAAQPWRADRFGPSGPNARNSDEALARDVKAAPVPAEFAIQDLFFTDTTNGWALGTVCQTVAGSRSCSLVLHRTTDGGRGWTLMAAPKAKPPGLSASGKAGKGLRFIRFANERAGWAFGPELFVTGDGGRSWRRDTRFAEVVALEAAGDTVWLIERRCRPGPCGLVLQVSSDLGGTWQKEDAGIVGPEASLIRSGTQHAWILSTSLEAGTSATGLVATTNGSARWEELPNPCNESGLVDEAFLSAVDTSQLWLICGREPVAGSQEKKLFISSTGGRRWRPLDAPVSSHTGRLVAVSETEAWLALVGGGLFHTTDGGRTWAKGLGPWGVVADDSGWGPVVFTDERRGFVAYTPALFSTSDGGGVRWERTDLPVPAKLHPEAAEIYAVVTRALLQGKAHEFRKIFLRSWVGGWLSTSPGAPRTDLPRSTQKGIVRRLEDLLPVELADDRLMDELYDDILTALRGGGRIRDKYVIVTLGAIVPAQDGLHVTAGASGVTGWGSTYVVAREDGEWRVTGATGPSWIS